MLLLIVLIAIVFDWLPSVDSVRLQVDEQSDWRSQREMEPHWEWLAQRGFQSFSLWVNFYKQKTCSSVKGGLTHACALDLWHGGSLSTSASGLVPALAISSGFGLPSEMRDQPHMSPSWSLRLKEKAQMALGLEWDIWG